MELKRTIRTSPVRITVKEIGNYQFAHKQHPECWSKQLRSWEYIPEVYLNLGKEAA